MPKEKKSIINSAKQCVAETIKLLLGISFFFLYPHYQKYTYMEDCKQNGHQKDWCEKTWLELLELE